MLSRIEPSSGKLLISEPFLMDPNFRRSVILLTDHSEEGTVGFVLNQPTGLMLNELISDLDGAHFPLFSGGPVAKDTVHYIHRCNDKLGDGIEIGKGIYWGGNFEALKVLIDSRSIDQSEIKFFLGYSGWGTQQLDNELRENTWIVSEKYDSGLIFSGDEEALWREVVVNLGPKYAHISNFPENPNLN